MPVTPTPSQYPEGMGRPKKMDAIQSISHASDAIKIAQNNGTLTTERMAGLLHQPHQ